MVTGVLVTAASLALLHVLVTLFGVRPAILVPLAVYMFGPLSLGTVAWWSAALEALPLQLAIFMAVAAHVRYLRRPSLARAVVTAVWLAVGVAAADQGAVLAGYLADATAVLALCTGLAFIPLGPWPAEGRPELSRTVRVVTLLAFCVFAAGAVVSRQAFETANPARASRSYISTARLAVEKAPRGTVIVAGPAPATIMNPVFFSPSQGSTSQITGTR